MKRIILALVLVLTAASLYAGGKECDVKKHASKNVELTGTIVSVDGSNVFRVANSDESYTVCEKTKASVLKLGTAGTTLRVKGKVVSCGEGQELMIEKAEKI
ncbi:MAG TPA: hypothetical protein VJZ00_21890 [Thermoanaerobaculia bacterium]|nr:hypothetical protein [Thermoanaerobaculia bacterium]